VASSCSSSHAIVLAAVWTWARTDTEAPQLLGGALVPVDDLVELEGVDLAGVIAASQSFTPTDR